MVAKICGVCAFMEHLTHMCPTLQETKSDQPENVGAIGEYQYRKQPYQTRPFDNQQYGRQSFRLGPPQGPYATQRVGPTPNMPQGSAGYQLSNLQYQVSPFQQQQQQQRVPTQGNPPPLEDLMKQLTTSNLKFQQFVSSSNMHIQQNSAGSSNLPSTTIPNPRGNAIVVTLKTGKELPQPTLQQLWRSVVADSEPNVDSQSRPEKTVPMPFPTRTVSAREPELDKELLKMFRKVEINIPLLDAIKQIPKYAKFLKELCVYKRKKIKGSMEIGGVVSALTRNEELTAGDPQALAKKCRDPRIFSVPCTIGECTFADAMLDLGASINVMPASIYRTLNFGDLEPTRMTIQLANRSIVQPLGVLKDVLVQVNELIFPIDFYVLDMEDETSGKKSTLILGRPFLMTARTKIDVHAEMLSMEFGDTLVQFNIFEAMKHPIEDHSLFGIDMIEELVEYFQLDSCSEDIEDFAENVDVTSYLGSITEEADYEEVHNLSNFEDNNDDIADLDFEVELFKVKDQVCNHENLEYTEPKSLTENSSSTPPPMELNPLPNHLKYAYLDNEEQLHATQEDKIGWKLSDLPGINLSICMHRILMEEEIKPIRQQQRRLNLTIWDVVKKEVTKLLATRIIYAISDSQWVSLVQVVPKKSGMIVAKNQQDELVPMRIQNSWRVCIDYRKLNQPTRKDHFPLPFIDQVLEKLSGKSYYCFLDGFSGYMQIHIAPEDQHRTTFTYPFGTFAYTRMPFGLCNAPSTFQHCMINIFSYLLQD
ncbi:hypothetical protein CR513_20409, partial [Mucuna pruriens]